VAAFFEYGFSFQAFPYQRQSRRFTSHPSNGILDSKNGGWNHDQHTLHSRFARKRWAQAEEKQNQLLSLVKEYVCPE
jgi:hypothetical protein